MFPIVDAFPGPSYRVSQEVWICNSERDQLHFAYRPVRLATRPNQRKLTPPM